MDKIQPKIKTSSQHYQQNRGKRILNSPWTLSRYAPADLLVDNVHNFPQFFTIFPNFHHQNIKEGGLVSLRYTPDQSELISSSRWILCENDHTFQILTVQQGWFSPTNPKAVLSTDYLWFCWWLNLLEDIVHRTGLDREHTEYSSVWTWRVLQGNLYKRSGHTIMYEDWSHDHNKWYIHIIFQVRFVNHPVSPSC